MSTILVSIDGVFLGLQNEMRNWEKARRIQVGRA